MRRTRVFNAMSWKAGLGELVLIVAGVSIALAASAWYEDGQERAEEDAVLRQLTSALESDAVVLSNSQDRQEQLHRDLLAFIDHLEHDADETYDGSYGSVTGFVGMRINTAPYEALKSRGLALVSNDSLRLTLVQYYEGEFPNLAVASRYDQEFSTNIALPYYLSNFRHLSGTRTWIPLDHAAVHNDPFLANLCVTKLGRMERRILPRYESSLTQVRELLSLISQELGTSGETSGGAA
jgi:hypothetical protein